MEFPDACDPGSADMQSRTGHLPTPTAHLGFKVRYQSQKPWPDGNRAGSSFSEPRYLLPTSLSGHLRAWALLCHLSSGQDGKAPCSHLQNTRSSLQMTCGLPRPDPFFLSTHTQFLGRFHHLLPPFFFQGYQSTVKWSKR